MKRATLGGRWQLCRFLPTTPVPTFKVIPTHKRQTFERLNTEADRLNRTYRARHQYCKKTGKFLRQHSPYYVQWIPYKTANGRHKRRRRRPRRK